MWPCAFSFLVLEEYNLETIDHIIHMSLLSHCPLLVAACLVYSGFTTILFGILCPEFFAAFPSIFQHFPRFPADKGHREFGMFTVLIYMYVKYHRDYKANYLNFNCNLIKG